MRNDEQWTRLALAWWDKKYSSVPIIKKDR